MTTDEQFQYRLAHALAMLKKTGVTASGYAPPLFRLLWKLNVRVPPPHMNVAPSAVMTGGVFGLVWGSVMWCMRWQQQGMPVGRCVTTVLLASVMFGGAMGVYLWRSARRYGIPRWRDFEP